MRKIRVDFEDMLEANKALKALREKGFGKAHLDMVDNYIEEYSEEINVPGSSNGPSLSSLVLKSGSPLRDVPRSPLLAASPMVSGMGSFCEIAGNAATRLVVHVDEEKEAEAREILKGFNSAKDC